MSAAARESLGAARHPNQFGSAAFADSAKHPIAIEEGAMGWPPMPVGEAAATRAQRTSPTVRTTIHLVVREIVRTLVLGGFVLAFLNVLSSPPATVALSLALVLTWLRMVQRDKGAHLHRVDSDESAS